MNYPYNQLLQRTSNCYRFSAINVSDVAIPYISSGDDILTISSDLERHLTKPKQLAYTCNGALNNLIHNCL